MEGLILITTAVFGFMLSLSLSVLVMIWTDTYITKMIIKHKRPETAGEAEK